MDGVLIIDKPAGLTSHDVIARVRRILGERRVGHTGTLDPFATGVLVVLVGRATRLAQFLDNTEKEYQTIIRLGFATDTGDVTGKALGPVTRKAFGRAQIRDALAALRGTIDQIPPMYSAKKQQGKKLYELARRGEEVERQPISVTIYSFDLIGEISEILPHNDDGTTDISVRVACSAGTYVRTLAEDFGKQLGVGAHVVSLKRTRAGEFYLEQALTLDSLAAASQQHSLNTIMITPNSAVNFLPCVRLEPFEASPTKQGRPLQLRPERVERLAGSDWVRMCDAEDELIAVARFSPETQTLQPRVVLTSD